MTHRSFRRLAPGFAAVAALWAGTAHAGSGNNSTQTGSALAQIAAPITLRATAQMNFGSFAQPTTGGTIVLSPYGTITATTGDLGYDIAIAQTTTRSAAAFSVTGIPGAIYTISGVAQVTLSNGSATITLGQFTTNATFAIGQIGSNGTSSFNIGGTLTAAAGQPTGVYRGTFPITVTYY